MKKLIQIIQHSANDSEGNLNEIKNTTSDWTKYSSKNKGRAVNFAFWQSEHNQ